MLTQIDSQRKDTLVYEMSGFISKEEIEYIDNGIDFMLSAFNKINLMIYINVKGESISSLLKEFQLGIKYADNINKIAFVSDKKYLGLLVSIDNLSTKIREKYFETRDIAKAWYWLAEE